MLRNISIKAKLIWSYALIFAITMTALAVALMGEKQITTRTDAFFQTDYARQTAYQEMFSQGLLSGIALRNLVLKPQLKKPFKVVPKSIGRFDAALEQAKRLSANDADSLELLKQVEQHWQASKAAKLEVLSLMKAGDVDGATTVLTKQEHPNWQKTRVKVQTLFDKSVNKAKETREAVVTESAAVAQISIAMAIAALVVGIVVALINIRSVGRAFGSIIASMHEIASGEGDLTRRLPVDSKNEVGQMSEAFNTFVEKIQVLVGDVAASIQQVRDAASNMTEVSANTRAGFERQLLEIEQVATAMHEMTATVQDVAHNASDASSAASDADRASASGNDVVRDVIRSIDDLDNEINQTADTIHSLHSDSEQIGSVLDVIRGIAEQTNLLALNAAIEAARAGEQGRGFAVVADEVRTLASRTQESTQEIQETIEKLQEGAKAAVRAMERGQQSARDSVGKAEQAGESLDGITASVSRIAQMNSQIAVAAEEQSSVAESINRNVTSAQELASEATGNAEQISHAAHDLDQLAAQLHKIVGSFRV